MKKKGALELSIGTIVVLVIAMAMLIMGLVLVRTIFSGGTDAINKINDEVMNGIDEMFADSDDKIVIYPSTRKVKIEQRTQGEGFAFSVRNVDLEEKDFIYSVGVDPGFNIADKCKINAEEANGWLDIDSGSFTLGRSSKMEKAEVPLITFNLPDNAPVCTIPYKVQINYADGGHYASGGVNLIVKAR